MSQSEIHYATPADAPGLVEMHESSWREIFRSTETYPPRDEAKQQWLNAIVHGLLKVLVARDGAIPVAFLAMTKGDNTCEITDLYVSFDYRRSGLGSTLLASAIKSTSAQCSVVLWVAQTNSAAIKLYESAGFEATGRIKVEPRRLDKAQLIEMKRSPSRHNTTA